MASLGILSGSSPLLILLIPLFFSLYSSFLLLPPPSFSSLSLRPPSPVLFRFGFSQGACPKWLRPTWQHPLVALAQSGGSSPCRAPFAWCHLCFAAIIDRCFYVPPMMPMPTMLTAAVDHLLYVSRHSLTTSCRIFPLPSSFLNVSWHSLHHLFLILLLPRSS